MARIMLVDDDEAFRRSLARVLERDGHDVEEKGDGKSALRHFAGDPPDLVISDVYMPDMDGIEFLMKVRGAFPEARIIMMSGGGGLEASTVLEASSALGANQVLRKPFSIDDFEEAVRSILTVEP